MTPAAVLDSLYLKQRARRTVAWVGGALICLIVATVVYDIVRSYYATVDHTGRELDTQARVIAEQTARSIQAVDVVLKHLVTQLQSGTLRDASRDELHLYLKEQAVGLVQADGLVVFNPDGGVHAVSQVPPARLPKLSVAGEAPFERMRHTEGLAVDNTRISAGTKRLVFPLARRLLTPTGEFAGVVGAPGQVEYFERFYRDTYPDPSTRISLMHRDGWLLARHPHAGSMLGKRLDVLDKLLPASVDAPATITRIPSPVDGLDHFVAVRLVPDYPLAVAVSRDAHAALAPWLAQSIGAALRTLAFAALAAVLLALVMRQFTRLSQSEERFALAVAGSDDGILDWDIANDRMFASARALSILGLPPDTVVRTRAEWEALLQFHADDAQLYADDFRRHLEGEIEVREGEYRVRHADGQYRWVRIRGMSVRNDGGQAIRWAGSVSDIDARNRAEEGLRLSEERFALAVAGSNDGIVDWDVVNDRMYSSERAMQILGIESGVTLRTRAQWSALINYHPDDVQRMRDDLQSFLDGHTELREGEYRVLLPNGKYRWIRHRNKCVRDRSGNPIRVAGSVSDIDAYKRVEGQLLQSKKLEAIGTLAGGIAHDFNNILAAILGYGEMAQKDALPGTPLRRHVDAVVSAGMRAKSLVERILAFSRSGIGERTPIHVQSVVAEALELVAASLPHHVQLVSQLDAGDAAVMGDPTQIHQVVMNLCANAAQAMKTEGTLTVALAVKEKNASVVATSALAGGRYVTLSVRDTGGGIPPHVLDRVFDPFFTTKEVGVGTGLGLSLVHGIVTDLGGGIDVDSAVDQGTTFTVYLPWSPAAAAPATAGEDVPLGNGETVMLIDDEEMLVRLGEEMVAALGYEPVGFTSSAAALKTFHETPQRFNAVLSDESMPDMTGSELAGEIRKLRPDLPVVLMSGFVSPALLSRARDIGIIEVLAKPLVERDIARSLANALQKGG